MPVWLIVLLVMVVVSVLVLFCGLAVAKRGDSRAAETRLDRPNLPPPQPEEAPAPEGQAGQLKIHG